jgi:hypothetical protein
MSVPDFQVIEEKICAHEEQVSSDDARKKADAVDLFIPGGGLALKLSIKGRAFFEKRKK